MPVWRGGSTSTYHPLHRLSAGPRPAHRPALPRSSATGSTGASKRIYFSFCFHPFHSLSGGVATLVELLLLICAVPRAFISNNFNSQSQNLRMEKRGKHRPAKGTPLACRRGSLFFPVCRISYMARQLWKNLPKHACACQAARAAV